MLIFAILPFLRNCFPYGRMRETPAVKPYERPMPVMETDVIPVTDTEAVYRTADGLSLLSPLPSGDPAAIQRGGVVYSTFCEQCHGKYQDGLGTVGQSFAPLSADLRSSKVQSLPDGILFQHISYGNGGRQPPLATTIRISDRWSVIAFIKSIGTRE